MKNIVLTGFMGAGKTAVGKELAHILGIKLIDVDTEIEKSEQITINEIFSEFGEPRFREIETMMIKTACRREKSHHLYRRRCCPEAGKYGYTA